MQEIEPILTLIRKKAPQWLAALVVLLYALVSFNLSDFGFRWHAWQGAAQAEAIVLPGASHQCMCHHEDGEPCTMSCCASVAEPSAFGDGPRLCACDGPGSHRAKTLIRLSFHLVPNVFVVESLDQAPEPVSRPGKTPPLFFPSPPEKVPIA